MSPARRLVSGVVVGVLVALAGRADLAGGATATVADSSPTAPAPS